MAKALKESNVKHTLAGEMPDPSKETLHRLEADSAILSPRLWGWRALVPVLALSAVAFGIYLRRR